MSQQRPDTPDTVGGEPVTEVQEATDQLSPEEIKRAQKEKQQKDKAEAAAAEDE